MTHPSPLRSSLLQRSFLLSTALVGLSAMCFVGAALAATGSQPGCCATEATAALGFEAAEPGPFLEFDAESPVFRSALDLDADSPQLLELSNPSDGTITIQARAVAADGTSRALAVELAAGDTASFDLPRGASHLVITGHDDFQARVENLLDGSVFAPEVTAARTGRNPRTNKLGFEDPPVQETTITKCQGNWKLECKETETPGCADLGPFTHYGKLEVDTVRIGNHTIVFHGVFWNLNTPTGDYTTANPDGLGAEWTPGAYDCPVEVTNDLGHTYSVTRQ